MPDYYTPQANDSQATDQGSYTPDSINQKLTQLFTDYFKGRAGSSDGGVKSEASLYLNNPSMIQQLVQRNSQPIMSQIQQAQASGIYNTPAFQSQLAQTLSPEGFNSGVENLRSINGGQLMTPNLDFSPQYMQGTIPGGFVNPAQAQYQQMNPQYNLQTQDYGGFNGTIPQDQQRIGYTDPQYMENQVQRYGQNISDVLGQSDNRILGQAQGLIGQQFASQGRDLGGSGYINAFAQAAANLAQGRQQALASYMNPAYQQVAQNTYQQGNQAYNYGQQNAQNQLGYRQALGQYNTDWSRQAQQGNTDYARQLQLANAGYGVQTGLANAQFGQQAGLANAGYQQGIAGSNTEYQRQMQQLGLGYNQGIQQSNTDYLRSLQAAKLGYNYQQAGAANDAYRTQQAWAAQNSAGRQQAANGAMGGAAGMAVGAGIGSFFGNPLLGAQAGGAFGSSIGKLF